MSMRCLMVLAGEETGPSLYALRLVLSTLGRCTHLNTYTLPRWQNPTFSRGVCWAVRVERKSNGR
jgi:hypothetical protein